MSADHLVPVYTSNNVAEAEVIRIALEQAGIRCALENELQAGFTGAVACQLLVMDKNANEARALIEQHEHKKHNSYQSDD